jgi:pyruvate dehydrogenase kinase 2/3/4
MHFSSPSLRSPLSPVVVASLLRFPLFFSSSALPSVRSFHSPAVSSPRSPEVTARSYGSFLYDRVLDYSRLPQQGITLQQLLAVGQQPNSSSVIDSARFLHHELPIRLAKKVRELESLPYGLSQTRPVQRVRDWYVESFRDCLKFDEIRHSQDSERFTSQLQTIYQRHANVVPLMAQGVLMIKQRIENSDDCPFLLDFLNRFYLSRIGIRLLISQHLAIAEQTKQPKPGYIGTIATNLNPREIIELAISDARRLCDREYGNCPEVEIIQPKELKSIALVPSHLHHILFELLKNSMRAVVESQLQWGAELPNIRIFVSPSERELSIKVSDQGGGIAKRDFDKIWSYMFTTIKRSPDELMEQLNMALTNSTDVKPVQLMAGFGYGLPIARLYSRYFGGDLELVSVEKYGTDAYLYLNTLGDNNLLLE